MPARAKQHWTTRDVRPLLDESRHWPRYELLDGELIVTPAPAVSHQIAVLELALSLRQYCARERLGITLCSPADLELRPGTITQPDIFVVPQNQFDKGDESPSWADVTSLVLAVEIVSPSSMHTDRVTKRDFYLSADVAEYWVVDLGARMIEQWLRNRSTPVVARDELSWHPEGAIEPFRLNVPEFIERVRVAR